MVYKIFDNKIEEKIIFNNNKIMFIISKNKGTKNKTIKNKILN